MACLIISCIKKPQAVEAYGFIFNSTTNYFWVKTIFWSDSLLRRTLRYLSPLVHQR